jgi:hypothetical protein
MRRQTAGLRVIAAATQIACSDGDGDTGATEPVLDCMSAASALASELYDGPRECATVLRLRPADLLATGFQVRCGPAQTLDEPAARAIAGGALGGAQPGLLLGDPQQLGAYLFYEPPGSSGSVAVISRRSGLPLFAAPLPGDRDAPAEILAPATWRAPYPLQQGCPAAEARPRAAGYDLEDGRALVAEEIDPLVAAVATTVVFVAYTWTGQLYDALLLRYPAAGAADQREWLLAVQGGPWASAP